MKEFQNILTSEMTDAQYRRFRKLWIAGHARSLVAETGVKHKVSLITAEFDYETWIGQAGDEARNEKILHQRELESRHVEKRNPVPRWLDDNNFNRDETDYIRAQGDWPEYDEDEDNIPW